MKFIELLAFCKVKDWGKLYSFLGSDASDLGAKILVSAVVNEYQDSFEQKKRYGLAKWDSKLTNELTTIQHSALTGQAHLFDFLSAWIYANDNLDDKSVARQISNYVKSNSDKLDSILKVPGIYQSIGGSSIEAQENIKYNLNLAFGDLETEALLRGISLRQNNFCPSGLSYNTSNVAQIYSSSKEGCNFDTKLKPK